MSVTSDLLTCCVSAGSAPYTLPSQKKASSLPPSSAPSSAPAPGRSRSRSPLSPPPPTEGFDWPDVQELRSKYSEQKSAVGRSRSSPEQMFEGGVRRHSSCSSCSSGLLPPGEEQEEAERPRGRRDADERSARLQRANSLDPRLSGRTLSQLQRLQQQEAAGSPSFFIAAEAPLPHRPGHTLLVLEKLPEPEAPPAGAARETGRDTSRETKEDDDNDDNYVQIRSPTSREKISIMAVIERCRAYQDSEEYRQREEARGRGEAAPARPAEPSGPEQEDGSSQRSEALAPQQQSLVKNLREKFQSLN